MERSGNFYKAIQLGYILISILIGCMAYNSLYEWQEIEALELGNKKIDELRKEINNINIQMIKFSLLKRKDRIVILEILFHPVILLRHLWELNFFTGNIGMCRHGLVMQGMR